MNDSILNVKCDPMLAGALRAQEGFHPAYHMNKEKWLTIRLDGSVPDAEIEKLIDLSCFKRNIFAGRKPTLAWIAICFPGSVP